MIKRILKNKKIFIPLIVTLLTIGYILVYRSWFLNLGIRTDGDWQFLLNITSTTLRKEYFSIWLSDNSFGRVLYDSGQAPTYALYGWFSSTFNWGFAISERLVHFFPIVLFAPISSFIFVKFLIKDKLTAALGALVYSSNTYFLDLQTGDITLAGAYAIAPAVIFFYWKTLKKFTILNAVVSGLVLSLCSAYEPRVAYIVLFILLLITFYELIIQKPFKPKLFILFCVKGLVPVILFLLLNLYWILGLKEVGSNIGQGVFENSLFGSQYFNVSEALTLFQPYWTGGLIVPFIQRSIPLYFWLMPIICIVTVYLFRKNRLVLFMALIAVLGIFLTKQSGAPFTHVYEWLFEHIPGFNAYREASKFYILIAIAYSILIPMFYYWLKIHAKNKLISIAAFILLALIFIPNYIPIATGSIQSTFAQRSIPNDYIQANKYLNTSTYSRILWVPQNSRWSLDSSLHPILSATTMISQTWQPLIQNDSLNNATNTDEIISLIQKPYFSSLLANSGVSYVVVPTQDSANNDNFYTSYGDDTRIFTNALDQLSSVQRVKTFGSLTIYKTRISPEPYFYSPKSIYNFHTTNDLTSIYNFWNQNLSTGQDTFNYTLSPSDNSKYTFDISDVFSDIKTSDIKNNKIIPDNIKNDHQKNTYIKNNNNYFGYSLGSSLNIYSGTDSNTKDLSLLSSTPASINNSFVISKDGEYGSLNSSSNVYSLGKINQNLSVYSVEKTSVEPITNFLQSTDCDNYDHTVVRQNASINFDTILDQNVLALKTQYHAICSGQAEYNVTPGQYYLHYQYKGDFAQYSGYQLTMHYNNGSVSSNTTNLNLGDSLWHPYSTVINVPENVRMISISFLGRPSNQIDTTAVNSYANLTFSRANEVYTEDIDQSYSNQLSAPSKYYDQNLTYKNLVPNNSFESGLWQKHVSDCNDYDNNSKVAMHLDNSMSTDGEKSLELDAATHIACTNTANIAVKSGATYTLELDAKNSLSKTAGYQLYFKGPNASYIYKNVSLDSKNWQTIGQSFKVPIGVTQVELSLYSFSDETIPSTIKTYYDNVKIVQIPDIENNYFETSEPTVALSTPNSINYKSVSNTTKSVSVHSAKNTFLMIMEEAYNPGWELIGQHDNAQIVDKSYHVEINGSVNGWYIDTASFCKKDTYDCSKNSDGSYNLKLLATFAPQKAFNTGRIIATITLIIALIYLMCALTSKIYKIKKMKYDDSKKN